MTPMRLPKFLVRTLWLLPLFELALVIWVGTQIGVLLTLGAFLGTSILGLWIFKRQGTKMADMRNPAMFAPDMDTIKQSFSLFAGMMLLVPGFITDIFGLLLLLPVTRRILLQKLFKNAMKTMQSAAAAASQSQPQSKARSTEGVVIEGEFTQISETRVAKNDEQE